ncbi:MAG TPA: Gfo/Idh/MocA family oxidoreductase [Chthoniobacterales bacterium]|nr:Gfo/Idh/MocA family oxidoreductase [Chthoniobacterales bacterium]
MKRGQKGKAEQINLGIIGTGWPGQQHARVMPAVPGANLHACADLDEVRRAEFEKTYAPAKSFSDYHELLQDPQLHAAVICLPNYLHFPASLAALEAGKHVFCEKPPTINAAEMKVLHEEATTRGLVYFFGRQFRFTPAMRAAKELIDSGRLGTIYHAKAIWVRSRGIPPGVGGWFTEKKRSGGGCLIDIGVHALDSAWYLMGTPRPVSVSAQVYQNFAHLVRDPVFDVEDAAYGFIRFENGAVVHLETSWAGNLPDDIPQGQYFGRELNNSIVYGTKGTLRLKPLTLFEDQNGALQTIPLELPDDRDSFELQLQNFVAAVQGKAEPINNAEQAFELMEMMDAIYASSSLGREVPIP